MKLKTVTIDGKTYAEVQDDKPVFVGADGKETAIDVPHTIGRISELNGEAKGHREAKESAEAKLKVFEGIDPNAAKEALSKIKNLDDKKLIDTGEAEKVRAEAIKAVEEKYAPIVKEVEGLKASLHQERIGGAFARSKFAADKLAIPADIVQARFGQNFTLEDGKIVATDNSGNKLYSRSKPGEPADFEEALEMLVETYPHKDHILKGTGSSGGGAQGNQSGGAGGKTISRAEFDKLDGASRMAKMKDGFQVVDAA